MDRVDGECSRAVPARDPLSPFNPSPRGRGSEPVRSICDICRLILSCDQSSRVTHDKREDHWNKPNSKACVATICTHDPPPDLHRGSSSPAPPPPGTVATGAAICCSTDAVICCSPRRRTVGTAALRLSPVRPLGVGTWDLGRPYPPSSHLPRARSAGGSFCSRRVTAARRGLLLLDWIWVIAAWRLLPPCRCGGAAPFTTMRASVSNTSPSSRSASTTSQRCYLSSICVRFVFHPCDLCSFFVDLCFIHAIRIPFVLSNS